MTDREKLVELLMDKPFGRATEEEETEHIEDVADYLIANGVTVQKWIPVTERLPEIGSRVVACGEKGGVFLVKAEGKTTGFGRMDGGSKYRSFTHWMPLPEPPKG